MLALVCDVHALNIVVAETRQLHGVYDANDDAEVHWITAGDSVGSWADDSANYTFFAGPGGQRGQTIANSSCQGGGEYALISDS